MWHASNLSQAVLHRRMECEPVSTCARDFEQRRFEHPELSCDGALFIQALAQLRSLRTPDRVERDNLVMERVCR